MFSRDVFDFSLSALMLFHFFGTSFKNPFLPPVGHSTRTMSLFHQVLSFNCSSVLDGRETARSGAS